MVPSVRKNQNWLPSIFNDFFDYDGFNINRLVHTHTCDQRYRDRERLQGRACCPRNVERGLQDIGR